jgi:hypothetical protein
MKKTSILCLVLLALFFITSCNEVSNTPSEVTSAIDGKWNYEYTKYDSRTGDSLIVTFLNCIINEDNGNLSGEAEFLYHNEMQDDKTSYSCQGEIVGNIIYSGNSDIHNSDPLELVIPDTIRFHFSNGDVLIKYIAPVYHALNNDSYHGIAVDGNLTIHTDSDSIAISSYPLYRFIDY